MEIPYNLLSKGCLASILVPPQIFTNLFTRLLQRQQKSIFNPSYRPSINTKIEMNIFSKNHIADFVEPKI